MGLIQCGGAYHASGVLQAGSGRQVVQREALGVEQQRRFFGAHHHDLPPQKGHGEADDEIQVK
jgi:hypothetical protein